MSHGRVRHVVWSTMAGLAIAGSMLGGSTAAAEEAIEAPAAAMVEVDSSGDKAEAAPETATRESAKEEAAKEESAGKQLEGDPAQGQPEEVSTAKPDATTEPAVAELTIAGDPKEWRMDGEAYLGDPTLTPGRPMPEAIPPPGTMTTPKYKHDESHLSECVPPPSVPDYCSYVLLLYIDDRSNTVSPGEWVEWWITVLNGSPVGRHENMVTVVSWVPENVYFDTFSLTFWDSSQAGIDASDFRCYAAETTKGCTLAPPFEEMQWIRFLARGQVMWSVEPGDTVVNVMQASSLDAFTRPPTVVEITPVTLQEDPRDDAREDSAEIDVPAVRSVMLPVTGSSAMSLLLGGLGLVALGGAGVGVAVGTPRRH